MSRRPSWRRTILLTAVLALGGVAPAGAADGAAPVVTDDVVTVWPGGHTEVDVLANDTDPGGDDLAVCRLPGFDPNQKVRVFDASPYAGDSEAGQLQVSADARARGTYEISYYVCNRTQLTPATLTVRIRAVQPVDVSAAPGRPGWVRVTNHNDRQVFAFITDHPGGCRIDARGRVRANGERLFRVRHHRISWTAFVAFNGGGGGIADQGVLRRVPLDGPEAPRTKPNRFCGFSFGRAAGAQSVG